MSYILSAIERAAFRIYQLVSDRNWPFVYGEQSETAGLDIVALSKEDALELIRAEFVVWQGEIYHKSDPRVGEK